MWKIFEKKIWRYGIQRKNLPIKIKFNKKTNGFIGKQHV